jgi:hypothetical protein
LCARWSALSARTEDAPAVILVNSRNLAVFKSLGESDLSPRIITAIAPCVHTVSIQEASTRYDHVSGLMGQKSYGIPHHLGRFEQLRNLAHSFVLHGDTDTVILLPLAALNLPLLESFSLESVDYRFPAINIPRFGADLFTLIAQSHLPNLRRVHVDLEFEGRGFELVATNLIDALSSFFMRTCSPDRDSRLETANSTSYLVSGTRNQQVPSFSHQDGSRCKSGCFIQRFYGAAAAVATASE